jgi:Fur family ferric uptake transcriptional regulator
MLSRIEELCQKCRLPMTTQRRAIIKVLSEATDHLDVEEVYRRVSMIDRKISLATVYRTMRLFQDKHILERHEFGNGRARFEPEQTRHHDHLIDNVSGKVIEFQSDEIERLQQKIAQKMGYRLVGHKLELYGIPLSTVRGDHEQAYGNAVR